MDLSGAHVIGTSDRDLSGFFFFFFLVQRNFAQVKRAAGDVSPMDPSPPTDTSYLMSLKLCNFFFLQRTLTHKEETCAIRFRLNGLNESFPVLHVPTISANNCTSFLLLKVIDGTR
jgi:hypothetical protein